jgi:hypothetical protein
MHVAFAVDNMHCTSDDTRFIRYGLSPEAMENYAFAYGFSYTAGMTLPLCLFGAFPPTQGLLRATSHTCCCQTGT